MPAFGGISPTVVLVAAAAIAVTMVLPVPFPKIKRGAPLRWPMTATAAAVVVAVLVLQFRPASGSAFYLLALGASGVAAVGILAYYLIGPFTVPAFPKKGTAESP